MTCEFLGCDRPVAARGWCATHYQRWRRTGTPADPAMKADADTIAHLVGDGLSHREIAEALRVHPTTVRRATKRIQEQAGVASKAELAELIRNGR